MSAPHEAEPSHGSMAFSSSARSTDNFEATLAAGFALLQKHLLSEYRLQVDRITALCPDEDADAPSPDALRFGETTGPDSFRLRCVDWGVELSMTNGPDGSRADISGGSIPNQIADTSRSQRKDLLVKVEDVESDDELPFSIIPRAPPHSVPDIPDPSQRLPRELNVRHSLDSTLVDSKPPANSASYCSYGSRGSNLSHLSVTQTQPKFSSASSQYDLLCSETSMRSNGGKLRHDNEGDVRGSKARIAFSTDVSRNTDDADELEDATSCQQLGGKTRERKRSVVVTLSQLSDDKTGPLQDSAERFPSSRSMHEMVRPGTPIEDRQCAEETLRFMVLPAWKQEEKPKFTSLGTRKLDASSSMMVQIANNKRSSVDVMSHNQLQGNLKSSSFLILTILSRFVIAPSDVKRFSWEIIGMLLIGYDCVTVPLEVFEPPPSTVRTAMQWITRFFWTFNIFVSFCTGYLKEDGTIEMNILRVARRYMVTWLPIDVFVVGIDWLEVWAVAAVGGGVQRLGNTIRILRLVRLARLARFFKLPEATKVINEQIRSEQVVLIATIVKIMIAIVGVTHIMACMWYLIGRWGASTGETWIEMHGLKDRPWEEQYVVSFHWSLLQFSGELYLEPVRMSERIFAVHVLLFTIIFSASVISNLTTAMTRLQIVSSRQSVQLSQLRRFLVDQGITRPLAVRVQQNAQHALEEQKKNLREDQVDLLRLISSTLCVELHYEIYSSTLMEHPFFARYNDVNPAGLRAVCHKAIEVRSLSAGDVLFSNLEVPTSRRMFFVVNGQLDYQHHNDRHKNEGIKGHWLAEPLLWTSWTHCGTARAAQATRIYDLVADTFIHIISPFFSDHARKYAQEYVSFLNTASEDDITDLDTLEIYIDEICELVFEEIDAPVGNEDGDPRRSGSFTLKPNPKNQGKNTPTKRTKPWRFSFMKRKSSDDCDEFQVGTRRPSG